MRQLRIIYRLLFLCIHTSRIVLEVYIRRVLFKQPMQTVMVTRQRWARRLLKGVGVRATTTGTPPDFPCLILANHRSYIDPILMLRDVNGYPVAKAELANWPVIGKGAGWAGILYVQREKGESRTTILRAMADIILKQGFPVILFPEGTTSDLPGMLPFKKGALRTAVKWNLPVVPAAICFEDPRDFWVGDTPFLEHAWHRFKDREIHVALRYGPVMYSGDSDALEAQVRGWIEAQLLESAHQPASSVSL